MKNRLLRLCRRLNKVVIEDVLPILSVTEKEITPVFEELVAENRLGKRCDGVYFYKEVTKKRLPLFFECRTPAELELIKRCFCADLPCQQTGIILNFSDNVIGKFNKFFREGKQTVPLKSTATSICAWSETQQLPAFIFE